MYDVIVLCHDELLHLEKININVKIVDETLMNLIKNIFILFFQKILFNSFVDFIIKRKKKMRKI